MMGLAIQLATLPGTPIRTCAQEAQNIADKLQIIAVFNFNRVTCKAHPGGDVDTLVDNVMRLLAVPAIGPQIARSIP